MLYVFIFAYLTSYVKIMLEKIQRLKWMPYPHRYFAEQHVPQPGEWNKFSHGMGPPPS